MIHATLFALGRAELRSGDHESGALVPLQPKRLALLAYLAMNATRGAQSRDRLVAFFWPEAGQEEGRAALRQALHHLRQRLSEEAITSAPDGRLTLDTAVVRCDAAELEAAAAAGDDAQVLALYRGDFLDGLLPRETSPEFEEWMDRTRRQLRDTAARSAERLAKAALDSDRYDDTIASSTRWLEIAPDDERALRTLLLGYEKCGRAADALTVADRVAKEFAVRLGVPLSGESLSLIAAIRARRQKESSNAEATSAMHAPVPLRIEPLVSSQSPSTAAASPVAEKRKSGNKFPLSGALFAALLIVVGSVGAVFEIIRYGNSAKEKVARAAATATLVQDRLIVTDFRDGGSGLGAAIAAALRVDLAQTPQIRVLTSAQVRAAARRSEIPDEIFVNDSLVRTIAEREGVKGFVTGEVNRVAQNWMLSAQLIDARNGSALVSVRETAEDSAQLVSAIERLSRKLLAGVPGALASQAAIVPLDQVTTASIGALRAYSEGLKLIDDGERIKGITSLELAVSLDSGFATAWRMLGATWSAMNEPARSSHALERAFANRTRLTFRERYLLEGSYYRNVKQDYTAATNAYRTLLATYPGDLAATNNLALTYVSLNAHAEAESLLKRVIATDSTIAGAYLTLAEQTAMQRKFGAADSVMREAKRRFPDHVTVRLTPIYLATAQQRWAEAESLATVRLNSDLDGIMKVDALQTLARIELLRGKVLVAEKHLDESLALALKEKSEYRYLTGAITSAWSASRYHNNSADAREILANALKRIPLESIPHADRPLGALIEVMTQIGLKAEAKRLAGGMDAPAVTEEERAYVRALLQIAEGNAAAGAAILAEIAAAGSGCPMCVLPALASARAAAGDTTGAIRAAEEYLASPYIHRFEPDAFELAETISRLASWYEKTGDSAKARATWQKLVDLWVNADSTVSSRRADARRYAAGNKR